MVASAKERQRLIRATLGILIAAKSPVSAAREMIHEMHAANHASFC